MKLDEFICNSIKNDYKNGLNIKEISEKYNVAQTTVRRNLKKDPSCNYKTTSKIKIPDNVLNEIYNRLQNGELVEDLSIEYNFSIKKIRSELRENGYVYKKPMDKTKNIWTKDEEEYLIKNYGNKTSKEMYIELNKKFTITAIKTKARRLGLVGDYRWDYNDEKFVIDNYDKMTIDEIANKLNKSKNAICGIAVKHGLKNKLYLDSIYNKEQLQFIKDNWKTKTDEEIAKILGKTKVGIMEQRHKLNLYTTRKDYCGYESIDKLFRSKLTYWKNESMKSCNYECIITGSKNYCVHHIYSFNMILKETYETLDSMGLLHSKNIEDYTKDELDVMIDIFLDIHGKYPFGICLEKNIHELFHNIYGRGNNNLGQFLSFVDNNRELILNNIIF